MKTTTSNGVCALCLKQRPLLLSHIIPSFVIGHQKATSSTGFLRSSKCINRREQDGEKSYLLCAGCEAIFGRDEATFAAKIYQPWNDRKATTFTYEHWLLRFAVSVSWRALLRQSEGMAASEELQSKSAWAVISRASETWRQFLLGNTRHPGEFEQHMLLLDALDPTQNSATVDMPANLNRFLTRGTYIGMSLVNGSPSFIYTKMGKVHLFGFLGFENPKHRTGTKIHVAHGTHGGDMSVPREIRDYLFDRAAQSEQRYATLSAKQQNKITETMKNNAGRLDVTETFATMQRDVEMFGKDKVFWREREARK